VVDRGAEGVRALNVSAAPDPRFEAFAAREPYFSVLTAPKFLRANFSADHEREFFESGEDFDRWIFWVIEQRLSPHFRPMSVLEYGCGPGRLAIPFARRPGSVTAVDRSRAMLDVAKLEANRHGAGHIDFLTTSEFFASARKFDLVVCVHVLQRLPPDEGLSLIEALLDRIASGGIGVFHVPFVTKTPGLVRAARWAREHLPFVNGLTNLARGRPFGDPLIPSHTYHLDDVLRACDRKSIPAAHAVFEHEQELTSAYLFCEVPLPSITGVDERGRPLPGTTLGVARREPEPPIAVGDLVSSRSIDELNRTAEEYFASLTDWEKHLAKPFSQPVEMPSVLANVATLLDGLKLTPGTTVLEFGAGTGWLSRWLTQLGCRVILLDVSPTALRMAKALYDRMAVIGDRPAPEFLEFDGRRIALPDQSVDRVLTFDAFHHVPNPDAVITEFGRILKPGGIAGFAEPGARHSLSPMSQFEMRTYAVVENDVDVHAIWRTARQAGFKDLELAVFHGPPFYVSLAEYEDFLAAGQTTERWLTSTRVFLRDVRNFFLFKEGVSPADSRTVEGLSCEITARLASQPLVAGTPIRVVVAIRNSGRATWLVGDARYGGVEIGVHLYDSSGRLQNFDFYRGPLTDPPREVHPGETVEREVTLPPLGAGVYRLEFDCVASHVTWFAQIGSRPATIPLSIGA
jgi:2-polyprenyl-3-methyl-5-hydroxy-6-metoxy-1,4-benzoquinol methylase